MTRSSHAAGLFVIEELAPVLVREVCCESSLIDVVRQTPPAPLPLNVFAVQTHSSINGTLIRIVLCSHSPAFASPLNLLFSFECRQVALRLARASQDPIEELPEDPNQCFDHGRMISAAAGYVELCPCDERTRVAL